MLSQWCRSIDFDRLLPQISELDYGLAIAAELHNSFAALLLAAESGCELCAAIEKSTSVLIKQEASRKDLQPEPVCLKMKRKGRENAAYLGCMVLWVHCLGKVIAQLEIYVPEGMFHSPLLTDNHSP